MDAYEYLPAVTLCTMPCEQLAGPPGVFVVATSPLGMALTPTIGALHSKKSNQETRYKAVRPSLTGGRLQESSVRQSAETQCQVGASMSQR